MNKVRLGSGEEGGTTVDIPQVLATDATLANIMNMVYFWAAIVAVIVIIIAGFFYVTSNGNAQNIERAKNAILGGVVGLIVVLFAFVITQVIINIAQ